MAQPHSTSRSLRSARPEDEAPADPAMRAAERRVREQEAHVLRLIVQGAPTQFAEDLLRKLTAVAEDMKARRRQTHR
ncbi:MAG TPA: hypothetical protein VH913_00700 [Hyphomicrobiaceae bacterium]